MNIVFIFAIIILSIFSIVDLKYKTLGNKPIFFFFIIGVVYRIFAGNWFSLLIGIVIMTMLSLVLYRFVKIGGADTKLLVAIVPFIDFSGIGDMSVNLFLFLFTFGFCAIAFSQIWIRLFKFESGEIPLIPIITLAYAVSWLHVLL
jgi:Flp pilus assembly protein protease CpaA